VLFKMNSLSINIYESGRETIIIGEMKNYSKIKDCDDDDEIYS